MVSSQNYKLHPHISLDRVASDFKSCSAILVTDLDATKRKSRYQNFEEARDFLKLSECCKEPLSQQIEARDTFLYRYE
jgi:hypothetical protein